MPKRYIIDWDPPKAPTASSGTSTARFRFKDQSDPHDDCPKHPKDAVVQNARRTSPDASGKSEWTCQEIHDILGVDLQPKPSD
jgi:hypothetical protein